MSHFSIKLLVFSLGLMLGIGSATQTRESIEQATHRDIPATIAADEEPVSGPGLFTLPGVPVNAAAGPIAVKNGCSDPQILPVWNAVRRDRELREMLDRQGSDCADMFELKNIDLNRDGRNEILVRGRNPEICGGTGNCRFWVLEKKGGAYRILLDETDDEEYSQMGEQVRRHRTNGYPDLLLKGHFSAAETSFIQYRFNGRKYVESSCLYEVPDHWGGDQPAKWRFISCREFNKDLELK